MTNNSKSPEEIEREIERERAGLKESIHDLQGRFSLDGAFQQLGDQFREHGGEFGRSVAKSARDNPMALALTGAGLAWLIFGNNQKSDRRDDYGRDDRYLPPRQQARHLDGGEDVPANAARRGASYSGPKSAARRPAVAEPSWARDWDQEEYTRTGTAASGHTSDKGGSDKGGMGARLGEAAGDARHSVASGASSAARGVSDTASSAAQGVRDSAGNIWNSASEHAEAVQRRLYESTEHLSHEARERIAAARARAMDARDEAAVRLRKGGDQAADFYGQHPLVVGALTFAVGAAVAGALPRTRAEDKYVGSYSDDLYDEAERIYSEEVEKAQKVVKAGVDEAKTVASDMQSDAEAAADKATEKAKSAADQVATAAKKKAEDEHLGDVKRDVKNKS
ncbi:DUF3618 domain-containing protein [Roseovarius sp. D0-M9]|uniref:DUF3618 domain-containing protein n=1 Tax=Roseovarius sp. D0-M9 TaxID=3127117 RepID=UPI0030100266